MEVVPKETVSEAPGGGGTTAVAEDVENPTAAPEVRSVVQRWKRENMMEKSTILLRSLSCLFSLISFIVMASNKHGFGRNFEDYEEYRYLVAIAVLAFLYSTVQVVLQGLTLTSGAIAPCSRRTAAIVSFAGDQLLAYLLISASSAAVPTTNGIREGGDNVFSDQAAASISMAFFAFVALSLSALVSGYKLSNQTYR